MPQYLQHKLGDSQALARHLQPMLRFLQHDVYLHALDLQMDVPEFGTLFEGEAAMLFANITFVQQFRGQLPQELTLRMLLATLKGFDPYRFTALLTAYPIARRAVAALLLERFLSQEGGFTAAEAELVVQLSQRLFELHRQAAQTKRIIEFFHVSKSGGTTFCQLGQRNGCKTQSFDHRQNCLIRYFRCGRVRGMGHEARRGGGKGRPEGQQEKGRVHCPSQVTLWPIWFA